MAKGHDEHGDSTQSLEVGPEVVRCRRPRRDDRGA